MNNQHFLKVSSLIKNKNLKDFVEKIAKEHVFIALLGDHSIKISDGIKYHIDNNIPLHNPIFRAGSTSHLELLKEAKNLYNSGILHLDQDDLDYITDDLGKYAEFDGLTVPLDFPMPLEDEEILKEAAEYKGKNVQLGKPKRIPKGQPGYGRKKFVVYVKDGDRVKRITFGDPNYTSKPNNPKARKSFKARHKCNQKKDKTKAQYWACRYPPNW